MKKKLLLISLVAVLALVAGGPGALFLSQGHWGAAALFKGLILLLTIPAEQMIFHPVVYVFSWADGRALAVRGGRMPWCHGIPLCSPRPGSPGPDSPSSLWIDRWS